MIKFLAVINEFLEDETEREIHYLDIEVNGNDGETFRIDKNSGYETNVSIDYHGEYIELKHERTHQRGFKYTKTKYIRVKDISQVEVTKSDV